MKYSPIVETYVFVKWKDHKHSGNDYNFKTIQILTNTLNYSDSAVSKPKLTNNLVLDRLFDDFDAAVKKEISHFASMTNAGPTMPNLN